MSAVHAVVPVKMLSEAKSRLAACLDPQARRNLVEATACHVLRTLAASPIDGLAVVTPDKDVAALARTHGAKIIFELPGEGLNGALDRTADMFANAGRDSVLVLPADLPLLDDCSVRALLTAACPSRAVLVTSSRDGGTNALLSPTKSFRYGFGPKSAARHARRARRAGLEIVNLELGQIAFDLDTPEDLQFLCGAGATS